MIAPWQINKRWSDRFLPEIKRICGEYLIGEAPIEEDRRHNTDLILLRMEPVRIACRVRRAKYLEPYQNEFTIRAAVPSGAKSELQKILDGWGDYLFYAFARPDESALQAWALARLDVFREWYAAQGHRNVQHPGLRKPNRDASSTFAVFEWSELPMEFVVAAGCDQIADRGILDDRTSKIVGEPDRSDSDRQASA